MGRGTGAAAGVGRGEASTTGVGGGGRCGLAGRWLRGGFRRHRAFGVRRRVSLGHHQSLLADLNALHRLLRRSVRVGGRGGRRAWGPRPLLRLALHVDDEAIRIGQEEDIVAGGLGKVDDHADHVLPVDADADLFEEGVSDREGLADEIRMEPCPDQIHEQARRTLEPVLLDLNLLVEVDDHAGRRVAAPETHPKNLNRAAGRPLELGPAGGGHGRWDRDPRGLLLSPRSAPALRGSGDLLEEPGALAIGIRRQILHRDVPRPRLLVALGEDLVGCEERSLAQLAPRIRVDDLAVRLERLIRVPADVEGLGHLALQVPRIQQGVVAVRAAWVALHHALVGACHLLPFTAFRFQSVRGPKSRLGLLGGLEERSIGLRWRRCEGRRRLPRGLGEGLLPRLGGGRGGGARMGRWRRLLRGAPLRGGGLSQRSQGQQSHREYQRREGPRSHGSLASITEK